MDPLRRHRSERPQGVSPPENPPHATRSPNTPSTHSPDQQNVIAGRLGRALAVFNVDEVVVYDDTPLDERPRRVDPASHTADTDPAHFLTHVLSYLECPPFMRKALFPLHQNLRLAGKLPSLDMPHHPHPREWIPYREGVTISRPKGKTG